MHGIGHRKTQQGVRSAISIARAVLQRVMCKLRAVKHIPPTHNTLPSRVSQFTTTAALGDSDIS